MFTPAPEGGVVVAGRVLLPDELQLQNLQVVSGAGQSSVTSDGRFSAPMFLPGVPGLALVQDETGKTVLLAFMNSAGGTGTIGPRETMVALVFTALGGFVQPVEVQQAILDRITSRPEIDDLTLTFVSLLINHPTVLSDGNPQLEQKLVETVQSLAALPAARPIFARELGGDVGQMVIEGGGQSGISVDQTDSPGSITVTNSFRRTLKVWVYKIGHEDETGNRTYFGFYERVGETIELATVQSMGSVIGLIQQAIFLQAGITQETAFVPKSTAPIALEPDEGHEKTLYAVVVSGAGNFEELPTLGSSEVLRLEQFRGLESDRWSEHARHAQMLAYFHDVLLPFIDALLGGAILATGAQVGADGQLVAGVLSELQSSFAVFNTPGHTVFPSNLIALICVGSWQPVTEAVVRWLAAHPNNVTRFLGWLGAHVSGAFDGALLQGAGRVNLLITAVNLALTSGDVAAARADLAASKNVEGWLIKVAKAKVEIDPTSKTIRLDEVIDFRASAPSVNGSTLPVIYRWHVSGFIGGLVGGQETIDTRTPEVRYSIPESAAPEEGDQDVVSVDVIVLDGITERLVGTAEAQITFEPDQLVPKIRPDAPVVNANSDYVEVEVVVVGARPADRFFYRWDTQDGYIIDDNGDPISTDTENPRARYEAGQRSQLVATEVPIGVDVFKRNQDGTRGERIGRDTALVTIEPKICTGDEGTPVYNGCGTNTTVTGSVRFGEQVSVAFTQKIGNPCGGGWSVSMNVPGTWIDAPGGTISGRTVHYPAQGSETSRVATYRTSSNAADYNGIRLCPRALGYYELPSNDTGPYVYVRNGAAHDIIPFVIHP